MALRGAVGFIGLGNMGSRMAAHLAARAAGRRGPRLLAFDLRPELPRSLVAQHASEEVVAAVSANAIASECSEVLLCLPDGYAVRRTAALMAPHLQEGALVIDCSTTGPQVAREVAAELGQRGVEFIDAPVTGAPQRAADGTLTVMVGGEPAQLERARPLLGAFASRVLHMGGLGQGQIAKALNNCIYNVSVGAMAEILPFAARSGLSLEQFVEVVSTGTGQSFGFNKWAPFVLSREFEAPRHGYPMGEAFKDFETLESVAAELGVAAPPVAAAARATYEKALAMGLHREHKGAMVKVWERELEVECRSAAPTVEVGSGTEAAPDGGSTAKA